MFLRELLRMKRSVSNRHSTSVFFWVPQYRAVSGDPPSSMFTLRAPPAPLPPQALVVGQTRLAEQSVPGGPFSQRGESGARCRASLEDPYELQPERG